MTVDLILFKCHEGQTPLLLLFMLLVCIVTFYFFKICTNVFCRNPDWKLRVERLQIFDVIDTDSHLNYRSMHLLILNSNLIVYIN